MVQAEKARVHGLKIKLIPSVDDGDDDDDDDDDNDEDDNNFTPIGRGSMKS